ncbi:hypothetical protein ACSBR2_040513 [Camellia fascicularis]
MAESNIEALKQTETPATEWPRKRRGFKFKKGRNNSLNKKQNTGSTTNYSQGSGSIPPCSDCGKKHKRVCYKISGACYRCGKVGHMVKDCPSTSQGNSKAAASAAASTVAPKPNPKATGKEPMRQGRVFALVPGDVQNTETVVSGILSICAQNTYVLIDSGSTHSYVSHAFSRKLNRPLEPMNYLLAVSSPVGGSMTCAYMYPVCEIIVEDAHLYIDLLPLNINHFDAILGMDWLTKYHATIDYVTK